MHLDIETHEKTLNVHRDIVAKFNFPLDLNKKQSSEYYEFIDSLYLQLEPYQHIQYIYVPYEWLAKRLLDLEVIKETKRVGHERYVLRKDKVFLSWEPKMDWYLALPEEEREKYLKASEEGSLRLVRSRVDQ